MPRWLGWTLPLNAFAVYGITDAPAELVAALPIPATIGEVWMIGYLLIKGIRDPADQMEAAAA